MAVRPLTLIALLLGVFLLSATGSPIKYVVTLMMENHSFDNMLGWLPGIGDLTGDEYNLADPADEKSHKYHVGKGASWCTYPDPAHDFTDTGEQIYAPGPAPTTGVGKPTMGGFAANYAKRKGNPQDIMNCYTPNQVPVISTLAQEFRVCTNWFASLPGPTIPNRFFLHAATTQGYDGANSTWVINATSIFDNLKKNSPSYDWAVHYYDWTMAHGIYPTNTFADNFVEDVNFTTFYDRLATHSLPPYSVLVPFIGPNASVHLYPNAQHPMYDVRAGELIMKDVYEKIRASDSWNETLLIITYDEHGGFWDKVAPGPTVNPNASAPWNPSAFNFDRLGIRVPGILISPWFAKQVDRTLYEHASVPATLKSLFNLSAPFLNPRDAHANTFDNNFLPEPRTDCPTTLPLPSMKGFPCYPVVVEVSGLAMDCMDMYDELLHSSGKKQLMSVRRADLRNDAEASSYLREAIAHLYPKKH